MRVVVGLGNPGLRYATTRHNLGFMIVDRLASRWRVPLGIEAPDLRMGTGRIIDQPMMLVQPQSYMNMSGNALTMLPELHPEDLIVIYDDLDLAVGRLRLRRDGGAGGHRGIASLVSFCGAVFDRVRVGIGRPPESMDVAEYVLQRMTADELQEFEEPIERASDAIECIVTEGIERAMNRFNARNVESEVASSSREGNDEKI
jgi:peptidyl-tRNA hydrolase, PTH1 family